MHISISSLDILKNKIPFRIIKSSKNERKKQSVALRSIPPRFVSFRIIGFFVRLKKEKRLQKFDVCMKSVIVDVALYIATG